MNPLKSLLLVWILWTALSVRAQNNQPDHPVQQVLKIDMKSLGPTKTWVNFDEPFVVVFDKIDPKKISSILVFKIKYSKDGLIKFADHDGNNIKASFSYERGQIKNDKDKLSIIFPPLKPNKNFLIELRSTFSTKNFKNSMKINFIFNNAGPNLMKDSTDLKKAISSFDSLDTQKRYFADKIRYSLSASEHKSKFFTPLVYDYRILFDTTSKTTILSLPPFLNQSIIQELARSSDINSPLYRKIFYLQQIINDDSFKHICLGQLQLPYQYPLTMTPSYDVDERILNLKISSAYLDSLNILANDLNLKSYQDFRSIQSHIEMMRNSLLKNLSILQGIRKKIDKLYSDIPGQVNRSLDQSTFSPTLQTTGKRYMSVDAGITNMWVQNNANEKIGMTKLFIGLNLFFRPINKNWNPRGFPKLEDTDGQFSNSLQSKRTILRTLCLTLGVTLGSMNKKDFANVYDGFSFTLGPSIALIRGIRVGTGVSIVKRANRNPLITEHKNAFGPYVSVAADYDLLDVVKNITGLLFK